MASPAEDIIDYLRYCKECGENTIELEPETVKALSELGNANSPAVVSPPASVEKSQASQPIANEPPMAISQPPQTPLKAAEPKSQIVASDPDFLIVGASDGDKTEGAAEQLRKIITAMGYDAATVPVLNICRSKDPLRAPTDDEIKEAMPSVKKHIKTVNPKVIVSMGESALQGILGKRDLSALHGMWFDFEGIPVLPTYHPAFMVKFIAARRSAVKDMEKVLERLGKPIPWKK